MKDRIQEIIKLYNLNASQFAEKIGVQKSSISHLVAGRNKASLDVVMKILKAFREVSSEWLMFGEGPMLKGNSEPVIPEQSVINFDAESPNTSQYNDYVNSEPETEALEVKQEPHVQKTVQPEPTREYRQVASAQQPNIKQEPKQEPKESSQVFYATTSAPTSSNANPGFGQMPIIVFNSDRTYSVFNPS